MPRWADRNRWDVIYARCFKDQPEGYALYKKFTAEQIRPGLCGVFDEQGDWQPIVDLTNEDKLKSAGYTFESGITVIADPVGERWPFRKTANVQKTNIEVKGGTNDAPLPAGGAIELGYKSTSGQGAILLTDGAVKHTQATPASVMCKWMVDNGRTVLANNPQAKKKGIWIITKTYTVPRRALTLLLSAESGVTLSVKAQAYGVGNIEATAGWWQSSAGDVWNIHEDIYEKPNGVVLAFDGIFWRDEWYSKSVKPIVGRQSKCLGGKGNDVILRATQYEMAPEDNDVSVLELVPELKGKIDGVRLFDPKIDIS